MVKLDDTVAARPQIGLDRADVVYIEQVEGGLTRLAAVFSSEIPQLIGPVRSARITDLEILAQYGTVVFAYSGAQSNFLPERAAATLHDYGAQRQSASFGDKPLNGLPISEAKVSWPASTYEFRWSVDDNQWSIFNNGVANLSALGLPHHPTTILIQKVKIVPSMYGDKLGGITPHSLTIGSGAGYLLRDGEYFAANWSRPDAESATTWTAADGTPLNFARGQVWVALVEKDPIFTARLTTLNE